MGSVVKKVSKTIRYDSIIFIVFIVLTIFYNFNNDNDTINRIVIVSYRIVFDTFVGLIIFIVNLALFSNFLLQNDIYAFIIS